MITMTKSYSALIHHSEYKVPFTGTETTRSHVRVIKKKKVDFRGKFIES